MNCQSLVVSFAQTNPVVCVVCLSVFMNDGCQCSHWVKGGTGCGGINFYAVNTVVWGGCWFLWCDATLIFVLPWLCMLYDHLSSSLTAASTLNCWTVMLADDMKSIKMLHLNLQWRCDVLIWVWWPEGGDVVVIRGGPGHPTHLLVLYNTIQTHLSMLHCKPT